MADGFKIKSLQNSVVRTNCIDCLDRTNVVQSVLARRSLTLQLRDAGVLSPNETVENSGAFEALFKNGNESDFNFLFPFSLGFSLSLSQI